MKKRKKGDGGPERMLVYAISNAVCAVISFSNALSNASGLSFLASGVFLAISVVWLVHYANKKEKDDQNKQ